MTVERDDPTSAAVRTSGEAPEARAVPGQRDPAELSVDRALGSDPHDFASLYIRHRSSFTALARHHLRDPRDVDDVLQEAFLRLFLAMPELGTDLQALAY